MCRRWRRLRADPHASCTASPTATWHTRRVRHPRLRSSLGCAATFALLVAGCGGDDEVTSDAERFCGEAIANQANIVNPPLTTEAEVEATLEFYRLMGDLAPVSIAEEWGVLVVSLETASSLVPGDPDSEQLVAATAYASEPSAFAVKKWLADNCGLDIPITTIAPQAFEPANTTTVPPPETTTPSDDG